MGLSGFFLCNPHSDEGADIEEQDRASGNIDEVPAKEEEEEEEESVTSTSSETAITAPVKTDLDKEYEEKKRQKQLLLNAQEEISTIFSGVLSSLLTNLLTQNQDIVRRTAASKEL
jgi:hypothetical protein